MFKSTKKKNKLNMKTVFNLETFKFKNMSNFNLDRCQ